ncbi:MAG: TIGR01212 family radical SAM protein, partial [Candidatus Aureabacteria bacterium]|nr:TIGR01212 family radical SAM protein [Candidatus Auribacterota bacterium]
MGGSHIIPLPPGGELVPSVAEGRVGGGVKNTHRKRPLTAGGLAACGILEFLEFAMDERYYRFSVCLRKRHGCRVHRIPLDAGFTCPTRDGTISRGGCLYCDAHGSAASLADRSLPLRAQMLRGIEAARRRYGAGKFIAYFQAFTNTYAPVHTLREKYTEAVDHPDVVGLAIGTRPDCVPDDVLDLIGSFMPGHDTWIEYGLQSAHDRTLRALNRGHTVAQFADAVARTH